MSEELAGSSATVLLNKLSGEYWDALIVHHGHAECGKNRRRLCPSLQRLCRTPCDGFAALLATALPHFLAGGFAALLATALPHFLAGGFAALLAGGFAALLAESLRLSGKPL